MARHWSVFVQGVSEKQARALDRMAADAGKGDGMNLLMEVLGCSRSKVGKYDRLSLAPAVDKCFKKWGCKS